MKLLGREGLTKVINIVLFFFSCIGTVNSSSQFLYLLNSAQFYQTDKYPQRPTLDFTLLTRGDMKDELLSWRLGGYSILNALNKGSWFDNEVVVSRTSQLPVKQNSIEKRSQSALIIHCVPKTSSFHFCIFRLNCYQTPPIVFVATNIFYLLLFVSHEVHLLVLSLRESFFLRTHFQSKFKTQRKNSDVYFAVYKKLISGLNRTFLVLKN
ncbi:hypothetical protein BD560DRAFT_429052 [Blakeslea trispora]|nr:hypothetical protein BD560DRAFT_429052 [Blakeslea trispora]